MLKNTRQFISIFLAVLLLCEQNVFAQVPLPNSGIYFSIPVFSFDKFRPVHLRYLEGSPDGSLMFFLDKGDMQAASNGEIKTSSRILIDHFLVGLALPDDSFWVNLRPDAPDNMIDPEFGKTEAGRILLEADLNLKKDMARLTSPRTRQGKLYWQKLYSKAQELFGMEQVALPAYTRPWIVPGEIIVRQSARSAYIYKADLKVMLEEDYLGGGQAAVNADGRFRELNEYSSSLLRELVIPELTKEVNAGRRYAPLRQVYYSLIFARWMKEKYKEYSAVPYNPGADPGDMFFILNSCSRRINTGDLSGLTSAGRWDKNSFFRQYRDSFRKGEYNESEIVNTQYGQTIRQYVSGGINFGLSTGAGTAGMSISVVNAVSGPPSLPYNTGVILDSGGGLKTPAEDADLKDGGSGPKDGESVLRSLLDQGKRMWSYEAVSALRGLKDPGQIEKAGMEGVRLVSGHVLPGETLAADYTGKAVMGELKIEKAAPLHFMVYFDDNGGIRDIFIRAHQFEEDIGDLKGLDPLGMYFISIIDREIVNGMPYLRGNDKAAIAAVRDRIKELVRGYADIEGLAADKSGDYQIMRPIVHDKFSRKHFLNVLTGHPGLECLRNFMVNMDFPVPEHMVYVNHAHGHPQSKGYYGGVLVGRAMFTNDKVFLANTFFHEAAHAIFFLLRSIPKRGMDTEVMGEYAAEHIVKYFKNSSMHAYLRRDPLYKEYYDEQGNIKPEYLNLAVSEAFAYTLESVLSLSGRNAIGAPASWGDVEFFTKEGFLPEFFFPKGFPEKYDMPKQTVLSADFYYALCGYLYAAGRKEEAFALFDAISRISVQRTVSCLALAADKEESRVFRAFLERALEKGCLQKDGSAAAHLGLPETLLNIYTLSSRLAEDESADRVWELFIKEVSKATPSAFIGMISAGLPYEVNSRLFSAFMAGSDEEQRADVLSSLFREHFGNNDDDPLQVIKAVQENNPAPLRLLTGGIAAAGFDRYTANDGGAAAAAVEGGRTFDEARLYKGLAAEKDHLKQAAIAGTLGMDISPLTDDLYRLLHPLYVAYDLAVKRQINPSSRRINGLYYGAGVDISNFLLSTNAAHGDFIAYYHKTLNAGSLEKMRQAEQAVSSGRYGENQQDYMKWKSRLGFGAGKRLEREEDIVNNLALELRMLGVDFSSLRVGKDRRGCPEISFRWTYPGEEEKEYSISFIDKSGVEDTESLYDLYDVYYQRAGMEIAFGYLSMEGEPSFLLKVYEHMSPGSCFVTDDHAQRIKIVDMSPEFPLPFPPETAAVNPLIRDSIIGMHRNSTPSVSSPAVWSYGWDMRIRRVPAEKPPLNGDGGEKGPFEDSGPAGKMREFLLGRDGSNSRSIDSLWRVLERGSRLLEIGSGRTDAAVAIAAKNHDLGVIATDIYNENSGTEVYRAYAEEWRQGGLLGQELRLDNLALLKCGAEILEYLPDSSLDYILLVNPEMSAVEELAHEFKDKGGLKKLKPGGKVVIRSYWWGIDHYEAIFGEGFDFVPEPLDFLGVHLQAVSEFSGNGELYVWTKQAESRGPGFDGGADEAAGRRRTVLPSEITDNGILLNNPYFRSLAAKISLELPDPLLLGKGVKKYLGIRGNEFPLYLMTKDIIPENDLPAGYPTVSGLREPRPARRLAQHLSEIERVKVTLPDRDIFISSSYYNGSGGCVKLGFLPGGEPAALKAYFGGWSEKEARERLLGSYIAGQIADDLGIGPSLHGIFEDDSGVLWMVMDIVPGEFAAGAGDFIKSWSSDEFWKIDERVKKAGLFTDDFQYYVTPNGHIVVIDTYFVVDLVYPGIELFSSELYCLLEYAGDGEKDSFPGKDKAAERLQKDGGDGGADGKSEAYRQRLSSWAGMAASGNKLLYANPYARSIFSKTGLRRGGADFISKGIADYIGYRQLETCGYLDTNDIVPGRDLPPGYPVTEGLRKPRVSLRRSPDSVSDVPAVDVIVPGVDIFLVSEFHNGTRACVKLGFLAGGEPVAMKTYSSVYGPTFSLNQKLLESYRSGLIADDLGIGPRVHGFFKDKEGVLWMVMDLVPGDFSWRAGRSITIDTAGELMEVNDRIKAAGLSAEDFQYYVTPNGHIVVIDTYFTPAIDAGIGDFDTQIDNLLKCASAGVREQFAASARDGGGRKLPDPSARFSPGSDEKGGIDFRSLPVTGRDPVPPPADKQLPSFPDKVMSAGELEKEWTGINDSIRAGNIPSAQRLRGCLVPSANGRPERRRVLCCIMEILRIEEECAVPCEPALLELAAALESPHPEIPGF